MKRLIKTRTGRKLHVANGYWLRCGSWPDGAVVVTGEVKKHDVCDRCTNGMDVRQFGVENVTFV